MVSPLANSIQPRNIPSIDSGFFPIAQPSPRKKSYPLIAHSKPLCPKFFHLTSLPSLRRRFNVILYRSLYPYCKTNFKKSPAIFHPLRITVIHCRRDYPYFKTYQNKTSRDLLSIERGTYPLIVFSSCRAPRRCKTASDDYPLIAEIIH